MKQRLTKCLAVLMAATMMLGGAVTTLASQPTTGNMTGEGEFEGTVNTDLFDFSLPTTATAGMFDFVLDPEGLIAEDGAAKYGSSVVFATNASLYFPTVGTDANVGKTVYDDESDKLTVTNKGTVEMDVTLTVELKSEDIALTTDKTFANDTNQSLYLALKSSDVNNGEVAADNTTKKAVLTSTVPAVDESKFDIEWNTDKYEYTFKGTSSDYQTFDFWLTGACNTEANWTGYAGTPDIDVVWAVAAHEDTRAAEGVKDASNVYTIAASNSNIVIDFDAGAGESKVTVTGIKFTNAAGKSITWTPGDIDDAEAPAAFEVAADGKITISAASLNTQYKQMTTNSKTQLTYTIVTEGGTLAEGAVTTFKLKKQ